MGGWEGGWRRKMGEQGGLGMWAAACLPRGPPKSPSPEGSGLDGEGRQVTVPPAWTTSMTPAVLTPKIYPHPPDTHTHTKPRLSPNTPTTQKRTFPHANFKSHTHVLSTHTSHVHAHTRTYRHTHPLTVEHWPSPICMYRTQTIHILEQYTRIPSLHQPTRHRYTPTLTHQARARTPEVPRQAHTVCLQTHMQTS